MRHVIFMSLVFASFSWAGVGSEVTDFSLKATDGKVYGLKQALADNSLVAVVFVATKCPYSNAYNDRYGLLDKELKKRKKVAFLPVNANDTEPMDEVKKHAADHGFTFPVLKDEGHKIADVFHAEKTPEVFLVDKNMKIVYHGRIDDDSEGKNITRRDLLAAVDEVLAGKPVSQNETKAFGCSIKRK